MVFTKKNAGIVCTLILVILLTQARFFDFLTENALGRMVLLLLIAFISHIHKLMGLLVVLCIIIAFHYNDEHVVQSYNYYEGFQVDLSGNSMDISGNLADLSGNIHSQLNTIKSNLTNATANANANTTSTTGTTTTETFYGREGFCMSDRETNILRGKQSNSVPVFNKARSQTDGIEPSDGSIFSGAYSLFS
jgi:hypothetical protein